MGRSHLFVLVLLVAGALAEEVEEIKEELLPEPEDPLPAAAPALSLPEPADASSGLLMSPVPEEPVQDLGLQAPQMAPSANFNVEVLKYTYTIINFSHNHRQFQEPIFSPQFWGPISKDFKWQLGVYPKGYSREHPLGVGVYVALSAPKRVTPRVRVAMLDNMGRPIVNFSFNNVTYKENGAFGWPSFVLQYNLENSPSYYLPNDRMTLEAEITFSPSMSSHSEECDSTYDPECKKIPFNKNFHSDIQVLTADEQSRAHAAAIAAHSNYLKKSIENVHPRPDSVQFPANVNGDDMREVLRFIYTGKINKRDAKRMAEVAKILEMDKLKEHAEEFLCLEGET